SAHGPDGLREAAAGNPQGPRGRPLRGLKPADRIVGQVCNLSYPLTPAAGLPWQAVSRSFQGPISASGQDSWEAVSSGGVANGRGGSHRPVSRDTTGSNTIPAAKASVLNGNSITTSPSAVVSYHFPGPSGNRPPKTSG